MARPKNIEGTVRVTIGATVLPELDQMLTAISAHEDRSKSRVIEKMLLRGLAAYKRDGRLDEVTDIELVRDGKSDAAPKKRKARKLPAQ